MTAGPATQLDEVPAESAVPWFEVPGWRARHGVVAGITTRGDGFNLGLLTPDAADAVTGRWRQLAAALSPGFATLVLGFQVHGTTVARHHRPAAGWLIVDGVDGHVTGTAGVLLTVTVADCIPVYLVAPAGGTVGLLHAGWRGVAEGIVEQGLSDFVELAGCPMASVVTHCGVAICGSCYEVGPEVQRAVRGVPEPRGPLDLRAEVAGRLRRVGVREVTASGWCTAHHREHFFSHRRSGGREGRMVAFLGVPLA